MAITKIWMPGSAGLLAGDVDIEIDVTDQDNPNVARFANTGDEPVEFSVYWPVTQLYVVWDRPLALTAAQFRCRASDGLRLRSVSAFAGEGVDAAAHQSVDGHARGEWEVVDVPLPGIGSVDAPLGLVLNVEAQPGSDLLLSGVGLIFTEQPDVRR